MLGDAAASVEAELEAVEGATDPVFVDRAAVVRPDLVGAGPEQVGPARVEEVLVVECGAADGHDHEVDPEVVEETAFGRQEKGAHD